MSKRQPKESKNKKDRVEKKEGFCVLREGLIFIPVVDLAAITCLMRYLTFSTTTLSQKQTSLIA